MSLLRHDPKEITELIAERSAGRRCSADELDRAGREGQRRRTIEDCDLAFTDGPTKAKTEAAIVAALAAGPLSRAALYDVIRTAGPAWHRFVFPLVRNLVATGRVRSTADIACAEAVFSLSTKAPTLDEFRAQTEDEIRAAVKDAFGRWASGEPPPPKQKKPRARRNKSMPLFEDLEQ